MGKHIRMLVAVAGLLAAALLWAMPAAAQPQDRRGVTWQEWPAQPALDQGRSSKCTPYAFAAWEAAAPFPQDPLDPDEVYKEVRATDDLPEWEMGTRSDDVADLLMQRGHMGAVYFTGDFDTVRRFLVSTGPVVVGSLWFEDMQEPNTYGVVSVSGKVLTRHAYMCNGIDPAFIECVNSEGLDWGKAGTFKMPIQHFITLLGMSGTNVALPVKPARSIPQLRLEIGR